MLQYHLCNSMPRDRHMNMTGGGLGNVFGALQRPGVPLNLFDSCYNAKTGIRTDPNCVYPVGVDPIWYGTKQELIFLNSFKMKFAVIIGVLHMVLGLVQKALNAIYFKNMNKFLHEFLPQCILLICIFGYMDFLIVVKWLTNYKGYEHEAPSIIVTIVNFFLKGGEIKGRDFISHNSFVEQILLCKLPLMKTLSLH